MTQLTSRKAQENPAAACYPELVYEGEKFNSISHFIGALLAAAGAAVLITLAAMTGDTAKLVGVSLYGAGMVLVYAASTIYHSTPGPWKSVWRKCDHVAIYVMIAGTFSPFCLITLKGSLGTYLLALVWGLAGLGAVLEMFVSHRTRVPAVALYFVMGFLAVPSMDRLFERLPGLGFVLLTLGGLLYIAGFIFYAFDKRVPHFHGVWHLFVLVASACQYFCVLLCILKS